MNKQVCANLAHQIAKHALDHKDINAKVVLLIALSTISNVYRIALSKNTQIYMIHVIGAISLASTATDLQIFNAYSA